jgi:hypothetical protein
MTDEINYGRRHFLSAAAILAAAKLALTGAAAAQTSSTGAASTTTSATRASFSLQQCVAPDLP